MTAFLFTLTWLASHTTAVIAGVLLERYYFSRRGGGGDDDPGEGEAQAGRIAAL